MSSTMQVTPTASLFPGWPVLTPQDGTIAVDPDLLGKKDGKPAKDISGMDCMPSAAGDVLDCIAVNDENRVAQRVTVKPGSLSPGATVALLGPVPLGRPPVDDADTSSGEFDGEGVAFAADPAGGGAFYLVGSHGVGRKTGAFRPSGCLLACVRVDAKGNTAPTVLTWRVSDVLRMAATVEKYYGKPLDEANQGLNIEGIAAIGDRLLLGLRAPSLKGNCYIVETSAAAMFADGTEPATARPTVFKVPAGVNVGIRDLTALSDGSLLALFGPAQEQEDIPYAIARLRLSRADGKVTVTPVGRLPDLVVDGKRGKAEALVVLGQSHDHARLLVMCDGIANGAPREFRVQLLP